jgi:cytochrome c556
MTDSRCDRLAAALLVWVAVLGTVDGQQPAAGPATAAPVAGPQRPAIPVATGALLAHTDQYAGATVSLTAAVSEIYGPTVFSVTQAGRKDSAADVLVVSAILTSPVQTGRYVTIIGDVIRFDAGTIATRLKDAAPQLGVDVVEHYRGRPAIVATSVIDGAMTDLAKRLPPPMTPEEEAYSKVMKQIGPDFTTLRQAVTATNAADASAQSSALARLFAGAVPFWKAQARPDALQWIDEAQKTAASIDAAAAKGNWDEVKTSVTKLQQICGNCHTQYRERLDDGSYRYKRATK